MRLIYVSDLHLREETDDAFRRFLDFLREVPGDGDTLVLGGDIFDLMIGAKQTYREKYAGFFRRMESLIERGTVVYYLEGNHDFHLHGLVPGGVILKTDDFSFDWGGKKIWVTHGDMIDPEDKGYRLLRRITRSLPFEIFLKSVPGSAVDAIGAWSSRQSRKYHDVYEMSGERSLRLRELFYSFASEKVGEGYDFVLAGHSHLEDKRPVAAKGRKGEYLNLGFSASFLPYAALAEGAESFSVRRYP